LTQDQKNFQGRNKRNHWGKYRTNLVTSKLVSIQCAHK